MDLHREVLAAAERAAHAGQREPHLLGRQAEARGDLVAVDVQPLGRDVEVDAALAVGDREPGLRAEEGLVLHADLVLAGDDDVGRRVGVAVRRCGTWRRTLPPAVQRAARRASSAASASHDAARATS